MLAWRTRGTLDKWKWQIMRNGSANCAWRKSDKLIFTTGIIRMILGATFAGSVTTKSMMAGEHVGQFGISDGTTNTAGNLYRWDGAAWNAV